jgi:prepilin-type processing-associated H-X9-DG protein
MARSSVSQIDLVSTRSICSWHPGGANFLFCDGSVRFLQDSMSFPAFQALCSINGGEVVDLP